MAWSDIAIASAAGFAGGIVGMYAMIRFIVWRLACELEAKYPPTMGVDTAADGMHRSPLLRTVRARDLARDEVGQPFEVAPCEFEGHPSKARVTQPGASATADEGRQGE